jgi:hypothetical protein
MGVTVPGVLFLVILRCVLGASFRKGEELVLKLKGTYELQDGAFRRITIEAGRVVSD